ncbi:hypothetical protein ACJD0Z_06840 [Flavobacteriaceae bacterium M23B6Z8]
MGLKIKLNLGFLVLEKDITPAEQEIISKFFSELSDYRLLYSPYEAEFTGEVCQAVQRLRMRIGEVIQELSFSSELRENLLALQTSCASFITEIKVLSEGILREMDATQRMIDEGSRPMSDQIERLEHYKKIGGANLLDNKRINLFDIRPVGKQMIFTNELGKLRGFFGTLLMILANKSGSIIPSNLKPILPITDSIEEKTDANKT